MKLVFGYVSSFMIKLVSNFDKSTESGSGSCPGYVGLTVGAGVGRYMGIFGLVSDGLISARVVTSDGKVVEVSARQNSDLFWAIRGAGANFGVITSATYKLHKNKDYNNGQLLSVDVIFPASKSKEYFKYLEQVSGKLPAKVAGINLINYSGNVNETVSGPICGNTFSQALF